MSQVTTFGDEAPPGRWFKRVFVVLGSVFLVLALFSASQASAVPQPGVVEVGIEDDFSELDRQIMETWIAQLLGRGFQRFLNGDGGGAGYEGVSDGPSPCPYCGATFPNNDQGWTDRAKHMLSVEWWKIIADVQRNTSTGSAG